MCIHESSGQIASRTIYNSPWVHYEIQFSEFVKGLEKGTSVFWTLEAHSIVASLHWRHNEHVGASNHRRLDCLLNHLFRRRSVNSPHKRPVTRKMFPFDDVIMLVKDPARVVVECWDVAKAHPWIIGTIHWQTSLIRLITWTLKRHKLRHNRQPKRTDAESHTEPYCYVQYVRNLWKLWTSDWKDDYF